MRSGIFISFMLDSIGRFYTIRQIKLMSASLETH